MQAYPSHPTPTGPPLRLHQPQHQELRTRPPGLSLPQDLLWAGLVLLLWLKTPDLPPA